MLGRCLVVYLLVTSLIACPLVCLDKSVAVQGKMHGPGCQCKNETPCCAALALHSDCCKPSPDERRDDHKSQDTQRACVCKGALEASKVDEVDGTLWDTALGWLPMDDIHTGLFSRFRLSASLAAHSARHFPPNADGRKVRALVSSLLL